VSPAHLPYGYPARRARPTPARPRGPGRGPGQCRRHPGLPAPGRCRGPDRRGPARVRHDGRRVRPRGGRAQGRGVGGVAVPRAGGEALRAGTRLPAALATLPTAPAGYYPQALLPLCAAPRWGSVPRPFLSARAVAREPLPAARIAALAGLPSADEPLRLCTG